MNTLALQGLPDVWYASRMAPRATDTVPSGHAGLDAVLPGGGWPVGALVELAPVGSHVPWSPLLLPTLTAAGRRGVVALVHPPHEPCVPVLAAAGLRPERVLWLQGPTPLDALWIAEQALACPDVAAVLAWLPRARETELRRLHRGASRLGRTLLFVLRPVPQNGHTRASCAPLRLGLALEQAPGTPRGYPWLRIDILKRAGPPVGAPLWLPAAPAALRAVLEAGTEPTHPAVASSSPMLLRPRAAPNRHALDCPVMAA